MERGDESDESDESRNCLEIADGDCVGFAGFLRASTRVYASPPMTHPRFRRLLKSAAARRIATALLALIGFTGCAHRYVLNDPGDLRRLPFRRGWEGINVVAVTPWRYMGSNYQTHEFRYYFDRDDALKYRDVSVARDRTELRFEEMPYGRVKGHKWATLQTDGQTFYFSLLPRP